MQSATPGRRRRFHSEEFKAQAVQACQQPSVSMAAVAMAHGINANLLRRWVQAAARPDARVAMREAAPASFLALPMPATSAATSEPIRIDLQRGPTTVAVTWPAAAAPACAAWLRELLR
jgi:transposase